MWWKITLALLLIVQPLTAQLVVTVAGIPDSAGTNDGFYFEATFNNPHGITVDDNGIVYTVDRYSHLVRKIATDGSVSTLAGSGQVGDADGIGVAASFNEPWGICAASDGYLYIADTRNNKIRRVDPNTGEVTTMAGSGNFGTSDGPDFLATFGNPTGIDMDDNGILYIADHLTHIIRKYDTNTGVVTTLAGKPYIPGALDGTGNGAAFYRPYGLSLDNDGNILVADEWNHLIRRITPNGQVTTVAGTGNIGHDDGAVINASFNYPWDMCTDTLGNIYVADGYNYVIRKITPNGIVSSYAGALLMTGATDGVGSAAFFSGATAIDYNPVTTELYVGDAYNHLVRKIVNLNQGISLQFVDGSTTFCYGEPIELNALPDVYDYYELYIDNVLYATNNAFSFTVNDLAIGTHTFSVTANNSSGSIASSDVLVTILPPPTVTISTIGDTIFYEGDSVTLIASFGQDYLWSTGDTTTIIYAKATGDYFVAVTDNQGCVGVSDTIHIEVLRFSNAPVITSNIGLGNPICHDDAVLLFSSYASDNQWLLNGFPIDDAEQSVYQVTENGAYQVQVTDSLGFTLLSNTIDIVLSIPQIENFEANQVTLTPTNNVVNFTTTANGNLTYFWNFGDTTSGSNNYSNLENPTHTYIQEGTYTVSLITSDIQGCTDTLVRTAYIKLTDDGNGNNPPIGQPNSLFIPSAFTPNNDGINDILYVRGALDELLFTVYNKWGELVFRSTDPNTGWDGSHKGLEAQSGTYVYVADIITTDGKKTMLKGHVTLLR